MSDLFEIVGVKPELAEQQVPEKENRWYDTIPWLSVIILILIVGGCLFCNRIMTKDPSYMDLKNYTIAPCKEFLFGTDTMGRDIFSMIWYGGRQSLFIGIAATVISTGIAIVFGTVSGMAPDWLDMLLMRATEILLSIPNLLTVIFLQAILGKANVFSLSFVIGITSWMSIAKIIRTEVRQLRNNEYVIAARCMGGGFFYILYKHLAPNFLSSIMFMVVMNIRSANIKFHRDRTSAGSYFMGKYAVTVRKSTAYRCRVDYPDSRCFSCCDTIVHYQYRRLYQKKIK